MDYQVVYGPQRPSYKTEVSFLNEKRPEIENALGGLTVRPDGTLRIPDHYKSKTLYSGLLAISQC